MPTGPRRAIRRSRSCLISWIQLDPEGGLSAEDGRQGSMKPEDATRSMARPLLAPCLSSAGIITALSPPRKKAPPEDGASFVARMAGAQHATDVPRLRIPRDQNSAGK